MPKRARAEGFQVFVRNYVYPQAPRELIVRECLPDDTVEMLRLKIHMRLRAHGCVKYEFAHFCNFRFTYSIRQLDWDDATLEHYGIHKECTIAMLGRLAPPILARRAYWPKRLRAR